MDCDPVLIDRIFALSSSPTSSSPCLNWLGVILGLAARNNGTISSVPQNSDLLPLFISLHRLGAPWLFLPGIIVTLISAKVTTLIMRMCEGDLSHTKKGNNFRPDSTESNKEHGQGLGGSSLVRSTMICFYQVRVKQHQQKDTLKKPHKIFFISSHLFSKQGNYFVTQYHINKYY